MSARGEVTAQRIFDAAYKLIAAHGCGAVTLQNIAGEAGVVASQICYYFGNKDRLLTAVLKRTGHAYLEGLGLSLRYCGTSTEHVIAFAGYSELILRKSPDTYRIFLEFCNFANGSTGFQMEVANLTSEIVSVVETCISNRAPRRVSGARFSNASIVRFIFSASLGVSLQHFVDPETGDMQKEFEIIKEAAVNLLEADADETYER